MLQMHLTQLNNDLVTVTLQTGRLEGLEGPRYLALVKPAVNQRYGAACCEQFCGFDYSLSEFDGGACCGYECIVGSEECQTYTRYEYTRLYPYVAIPFDNQGRASTLSYA